MRILLGGRMQNKRFDPYELALAMLSWHDLRAWRMSIRERRWQFIISKAVHRTGRLTNRR